MRRGLWDERRIRPEVVEPINANRKKTATGKDWQAVSRTLIGEMHH
jgi:hypothetical protein